MEATNKEQPAFASVAISENIRYYQTGLTKLEYFTAQALIGFLSNPQRDLTISEYCKESITIAERTLELLDEKTKLNK